jgi:hypothetical protein
LERTRLKEETLALVIVKFHVSTAILQDLVDWRVVEKSLNLIIESLGPKCLLILGHLNSIEIHFTRTGGKNKILAAYEASYPLRTVKSGRNTPYWSSDPGITDYLIQRDTKPRYANIVVLREKRKGLLSRNLAMRKMV